MSHAAPHLDEMTRLLAMDLLPRDAMCFMTRCH
jgi:hypothetical protein